MFETGNEPDESKPDENPQREPGDRDGEIDALESEMAGLAGVVNAASGRLVALVADGLARGLWEQGGVQSPAHWLTWQLGVSTGQARRILALARRAGELPATMAAFAAGELSLDQASVIARHVPADREEPAADLARLCTVRQLSRTLSRYAYGTSEADDRPAAATREDDRRVSFGTRDGGRWHLHADLPADEGAVVEQALTAAHQSLFSDLPAEAPAEEERLRVTWADALVAVAETSLATGEAHLPGAGRFVINAHLEADLADSGAAGTISLHLGSPLPSELRRLLGCDANIRPVAMRDGRPVNVGRALRIVPERTRRLVEHRDGGCAVPGCGATRFLQIHHVEHWEDGGATDTANLAALCRRHHRQHHKGGLHISGDADRPPTDPRGLRFADARGRPIVPSAKTRPPGALPTTPRYEHPTGEPLHDHWLDL
ncbi:MAG: HNH endonuclease [Acidimicrobiia bacterium]|nr:HNH endonuclease [Acidimicrobiia bacterium]